MGAADTVKEMPPGRTVRCHGAWSSIAAVGAICAFAPAAGAAADRPGAGDLSARLVELAKPSVRTAPRAEQAARLSVAREGPGSLLRQGNRVLVDVRFGQGAAAGLDGLRAAGAKIVHLSRRYQTVTVAARPFALTRLDDLVGVRSVTEVLTPLVHQAGSPGPVTSVYTPCFGAETSEGDDQLRAALARAKFEVDGSGAKVGILSDSFDQDPFTPTGAAEDVASGDLPGPGNPCGHVTPVDVLEDFGGGEASDEGRAMAQIVHDLAPGAALSFATAFTGEMAFADNIRALAVAGADTIVDDVSYFEEPFFQEGPIGVAVAEVTASQDVAYFSAAGNSNLIDAEGNDVASWEAPEFRDSLVCPASVVALSELLEEIGEAGLDPSHCMDFDPGVQTDRTFAISVPSGAELLVDLQWAEPWEGVSTDLDAFLLDSEGEIVAESISRNGAIQRPFEIFAWENRTGAAATVRLAINRFAGGMPRLKFVLLQDGSGTVATEYPKSSGGDVVGPTIFGHNGAEAAMTLGAIRYNTTTKPESFSSRGPVTHYFGPFKEGIPAEELSSPNVLAKPDAVATDGGANTFFGSCVGNVWRFFGTSAAAPHAAAAAALEREAEPAADATAVREAQLEAADPVGSSPESAVGKGLTDAFGALEELLGPPSLGKEPEQAPPPGPCLPPRKPTPPPGSPLGPIANATSDTKRPQTFFRKHPPRVIRTRGRKARAVFRFGSDEEGVTFVCRVDGGLPRFCAERLARRFSLGKHAVRVKAIDIAGNVDRTAAVYRFRVKRIE